MPRKQNQVESFLNREAKEKRREVEEESENESVQSEDEEGSVVNKPSTSIKRKPKGKQAAKKAKNGIIYYYFKIILNNTCYIFKNL